MDRSNIGIISQIESTHINIKIDEYKIIRNSCSLEIDITHGASLKDDMNKLQNGSLERNMTYGASLKASYTYQNYKYIDQKSTRK